MGDYTQLAMRISLISDIPSEVINIPKFIDLIKPYVSTKGAWGFFRTEEQFNSDTDPTTILDGVLVTGEY